MNRGFTSRSVVSRFIIFYITPVLLQIAQLNYG